MTRFRHNKGVSEVKKRIDELAELMDEFSLESASLKGEDFKISFSREEDPVMVSAPVGAQAAPAPAAKPAREKKAKSSAPTGTPISSPMTGIFYASPSPGSPAFVKQGQSVSAGDVIGLIEAMKVFNEITSTVTGSVAKICVENGQLVQPGEPLIYVE